MARLGDYGIVDYTPLMAIKPRSQNFLQELGIFPMDEQAQYIDSEWAEFEREEKGLTSMYNVERGADRQFAGDDKAKKEMLRVPLATLDKVTKPHEVQSFRQYGEDDTPATVERLVENRVEHIQRSHARYIRDAQYKALVENKVLARDADGAELTSLAKDFSAMWGAARNTATMDLSQAGINPFTTLAQGRENIIEKAGDDADGYDMVYLVSTAQFDAIVSHALVAPSYNEYSDRQEAVRLGLDVKRNNRTFTYPNSGITVVEDISKKIADTQGFFLPVGFDEFADAVFAPADTIEHANKISEGSYLFLKENHRSVVIESEVSYAAVLLRPELITDFTVTL